MSRIRSVHPGFFRDDRLVPCTPFARLLFIGLGVEADDKGIFEWKPVTLRMSIFPGDNVDMASLLAELVDADAIRQFEAGGRSYGAIRNFRKYQKPKTPNDLYPMPPDVAEYVAFPPKGEMPPVDGEPIPSPAEKSPQMEDGGGSKEEEKIEPQAPVTEPGARDLFSELLETFPRNQKCSESRAEAAWRATKAKDRDAILAAARRYALWFAEDNEARGRTADAGRRFSPYLATWIESGDWKKPLVLKADAGKPSPDLVVLRQGEPDFLAVQRHRGKPFFVGMSGTVTVTKAELAAALAESVH